MVRLGLGLLGAADAASDPAAVWLGRRPEQARPVCAGEHGPGESRYVEQKRHYEKPIPISDLVYLDRERCILCGRCTAVCPVSDDDGGREQRHHRVAIKIR